MSAKLQHVEASALQGRPLRYYDLIMAAFVAILLLSNIIGASKPSYVVLPAIGTWTFGAGVLFFPFSYIIGDVLTEVYGYARARRVIWTGFAALIFMAFMAAVVVAMPPANAWLGQPAYEFVFGNSWRIVLASMIAFWAGEFANSFVLAKMKNPDQRQTSLDADDRLDDRRTGARQPDLLSVGFLWPRRLAHRAIGPGRRLAISAQDRLGGAFDAGDLCGGQSSEARRGLDVYDEQTDFTPFKAGI